jgi:membrane protein implicated in regulation of membrane protease activity
MLRMPSLIVNVVGNGCRTSMHLRGRLFRKRTREEKIRKMRLLEAVSGGLSLTAAAIIISILAGSGETQLLFLAAFCCVLVAAYQVVNFYLGYKLQQRIDQTRSEYPQSTRGKAEKEIRGLSSGDASSFVGRSVV